VPEQFRDLHTSIADVSQHYHFQEMPGVVSNLQEWISNAIRWLADLLARLFSLSPMASDTRVFGDVMKHLWYIVGFLCALALILVIAKRTWDTLKGSAGKAGTVEGVTRIMTGSDWKKEADKLAEQSNWRLSCRALYMATLRTFDEAGVLSFGPSRTNYEYWYALKKEKEIQKHFRELADFIDESWFGNRTVAQADYKKCSTLLTDIEQEISKRPAIAAKTK
jgi:Domain of unknown function (DUF4129)